MPFDRDKALIEANKCEQNLQILYYALGIPFVTMKLLGDKLVVRCDDDRSLPAMCKRVAEEYMPAESSRLN